MRNYCMSGWLICVQQGVEKSLCRDACLCDTVNSVIFALNVPPMYCEHTSDYNQQGKKAATNSQIISGMKRMENSHIPPHCNVWMCELCEIHISVSCWVNKLVSLFLRALRSGDAITLGCVLQCSALRRSYPAFAGVLAPLPHVYVRHALENAIPW